MNVDELKPGDLAGAGVCYAAVYAFNLQGIAGDPPLMWPWEPRWWKPSSDPIKNLVRAGALIAAEIDRIQANQP